MMLGTSGEGGSQPSAATPAFEGNGAVVPVEGHGGKLMSMTPKQGMRSDQMQMTTATDSQATPSANYRMLQMENMNLKMELQTLAQNQMNLQQQQQNMVAMVGMQSMAQANMMRS